MKLEGSCHCGAVRFTLASRTPYPFMRCYCSICRKTAGAGGYAINIMGEAATLEVDGEDNVAVYRVALAHTAEGEGAGADERSPAQRRFCKLCGSALWVSDPRWPELVYPFAGAIDTPLPVPPETVHLLLDSKPSWVAVPEARSDSYFAGYAGESIEDWHKSRGLYETE